MTWNISIKFGQNLKRFSAAGVVSGAFAYSHLNKDEISESWRKITIPDQKVHSNLTTMFRVPRFINIIAEEETTTEVPPAPKASEKVVEEIAAVAEEIAKEIPVEAPAPIEEAPATSEEAPATTEEAPAASEEGPPAAEAVAPVVEESPAAVEEASISPALVAVETVPTIFGQSYVSVACGSGATLLVAYVLTKYLGFV